MHTKKASYYYIGDSILSIIEWLSSFRGHFWCFIPIVLCREGLSLLWGVLSIMPETSIDLYSVTHNFLLHRHHYTTPVFVAYCWWSDFPELERSHLVLSPLLHAECWAMVLRDGMQGMVVGGAWGGGHYLEINTVKKWQTTTLIFFLTWFWSVPLGGYGECWKVCQCLFHSFGGVVGIWPWDRPSPNPWVVLHTSVNTA